MVDLRISEFTDGGQIQETDEIATVRNGLNTKVRVGTIASADVDQFLAITDIPIYTVTSIVAGENVTVTGDQGNVTVSAGGGSGDIDGAVNIGLSGAGIFNSVSGSDIQLNRITGGTNITITGGDSGGAVTITGATSGEVNRGQNVGGGLGIYKQKSGEYIQMRTLVAGANITLSGGTGGDNEITITGGAGGGSGDIEGALNIGDDTVGAGVFNSVSGSDLQFNRIIGGSNITITGGNGTGNITITGGSGSFGGSYTDLTEVTATIVNRNADTGVRQITYNMSPQDMLVFNQASTVGHHSSNTMMITREADYTGQGPTTSWVNAALFVTTNARASAITNEWAVVGVMNNYAPVGPGGGGGGENVGGYFQGNHYNTAGMTWAIAIEANDYAGGTGAGGVIWGSEVLLRTSRIHIGNSLIVSTFFTRGLSGYTGSPGKIYAYGLCDTAWYESAPLRTAATNGWLIGDYLTRQGSGYTDFAPVDHAYVAYTNGLTGIRLLGVHSSASVRIDANGLNGLWDTGTKTYGAAFTGNYSVSAVRVAAPAPTGVLVEGSGTSAFKVASSGYQYGIDFRSINFSAGWILAHNNIEIWNTGEINFKNSGIWTNRAGHITFRLNGSSVYVPYTT